MTVKDKEKKVICYSCGQPIRFDELGAIMIVDKKEAWFHNSIECMLKIVKNKEQVK